MPRFSSASLRALESCDERLQKLAKAAIELVDFKIVEGHRNEADQNLAFSEGNSKARWPLSKHNKQPSLAFDFAPWPIDWSGKAESVARFAFVAGVFHTIASQFNIPIRFGWDWNRNLDPRDESFKDWPHVEIDER